MKSSPASESGTGSMFEEYEVEHFRVLQRAHAIFVEKSATRGQMWLDFPPSDKIRELRERVMRLENTYDAMLGEPVQPQNSSIAPILVEDALDTINYAAFLIKQIERGMRG